MQRNAHRLGAIFYALWGILHVVGGGVILATLMFDGGAAALAHFGTALAPADLPAVSNTVVDGLVAYHSLNIIWIGLVVIIVAVRLNWRNSPIGYWTNLLVVSLADVGLFVTQVFPGRVAVEDAMVGASFWLPAVIFSTIAIVRTSHAAPALNRKEFSQAIPGV